MRAGGGRTERDFVAVGEEAEKESVGVCRVRESHIVGECNAGVCVWGGDRIDRSSSNSNAYLVNQPAIFLTEPSN